MPEIPRYGSFLPGDSRTREPWHINQQTILRAGILGAITIALFVFLAVRLWALQIISGNDYLRIAQDNQVRTVPLQAPRGAILASNGTILVENRLSYSVDVWYAELPGKGASPTRYEVLRHLSKVLGVPTRKIIQEVATRKDDPLRPISVGEDVNQYQREYILERSDQFPGVEVTPRYVRYYPHGSLASQVLGYVGVANEKQMKSDKTIELNDVVGESGVEAAFDRYLRGTDGQAMQRIDSEGRPRSELIPNPEPQPGETVKLTISPKLQWAAQQALLHGIQAARNSRCVGCWNSDGGAIVALNVRDGSVLAMASYPTYPPSVFSGRVTTGRLARWGLTSGTATGKNYPIINRATSGVYPPGSTFKPVTAIAALQAGVVTPTENLHCTGKMELKGLIFHNWDPLANSWINLPTALAELLRHLLLPARMEDLRSSSELQGADPGLGPYVRPRQAHGDRDRRRCRRRTDQEVAVEPLHGLPGQGLEAGRLTQPGDRTEGPAGDAAADDPPLRCDRHRQDRLPAPAPLDLARRPDRRLGRGAGADHDQPRRGLQPEPDGYPRRALHGHP